MSSSHTDKWLKLFSLNDRMVRLYGALFNDVQEMENISGLQLIEALEALERFADIMAKATADLNEQHCAILDEQDRKNEVEDVLKEVSQRQKGFPKNDKRETNNG